jgi:hypothetical protein
MVLSVHPLDSLCALCVPIFVVSNMAVLSHVTIMSDGSWLWIKVNYLKIKDLGSGEEGIG